MAARHLAVVLAIVSLPGSGAAAGIGLSVSGGRLELRDAPGELTGPGRRWGLYLDGAGFPFGSELGYFRASLPVEAAGGGSLTVHEVSSVVKLYLVPVVLRPFVGAGLTFAWLRPDAQASELFRDDSVLGLPLIGGVELELLFLFVGARASYTLVFGESFLVPGAAGAAGSGTAFVELSLTAGLRF